MAAHARTTHGDQAGLDDLLVGDYETGSETPFWFGGLEEGVQTYNADEEEDEAVWHNYMDATTGHMHNLIAAVSSHAGAERIAPSLQMQEAQLHDFLKLDEYRGELAHNVEETQPVIDPALVFA